MPRDLQAENARIGLKVGEAGVSARRTRQPAFNVPLQ
jgi:hypothetical protein